MRAVAAKGAPGMLAAAGWCAACWPFLQHLFRRAAVPEELGSVLLAAGTALWLVWRGRAVRAGLSSAGDEAGCWWRGALAMLIYGVAGQRVPQTVAGVAALSAGLLAPGPWRRGRWPDPAVAGLLLLALPAMMMVELFFGYPLRLAAAALASGLLAAAGLPVTRAGAVLAWQGAGVWVDAPCSGVRMLWSGAWLGLTVCGLVGMGWGGTLAAGLLTVATVILVNSLRVAGLALVEGGLLPTGPGFHAALGVMLFAAGAVVLVAGIRRLARLPGLARPATSFAGSQPSAGAGPGAGHRSRYAIAFYLLASLCAMAMGTERHLPSDTEAAPFPGWPSRFEGLPLRETPLTEREAAFNTAFPGRIARFANGERVVILRWVRHPTHRVHSAADCLRSAGWHITYEALIVVPDGDWSSFTATRNGKTLRIRERCSGETGKNWPDVSSWFWSALAGRTRGPWWVVTVVGPSVP